MNVAVIIVIGVGPSRRLYAIVNINDKKPLLETKRDSWWDKSKYWIEGM